MSARTLSRRKLLESLLTSATFDAALSATTGSPTIDTTSRPGKTICIFNASGSITTTPGYAELLVVGSGGGGVATGGSGGAGGGGGAARWGRFLLAGTTYTVTIAGGGATGADGGTSSFGSLLLSGGGQRGLNVNTRWDGTGGGGSAGAYNAAGTVNNHIGGGQGGTLYGGAGEYSGVPLTITGSSIEYGGAVAGTGAGTANRGEGGGYRAVVGGSGLVVVVFG